MPFAGYYIFAALAFIPMMRIFYRAGFQPCWVVLLAVPDIGLILCAALLAFRKWPEKKKL